MDDSWFVKNSGPWS